MQAEWVIIDGYSLLHRDEFAHGRQPGGLESARIRLIRDIEEVADALGPRVTLVFDGRGGATESSPDSSALEVLFSPSHQTADTVIERLVEKSRSPEDILVVTSDRAERENVTATGAHTLSCGDFLEHCTRLRKRVKEKTTRSPRPPQATLGDFFPKK